MVFVPVLYHRFCEPGPDSGRDSGLFRVAKDVFGVLPFLVGVVSASERQALLFVSLFFFGMRFAGSQNFIPGKRKFPGNHAPAPAP